MMERALFLAERGRGRTTPNPMVGAVVVADDGVIVGQGAHLAAGGPHAEVVALDAAAGRARGATLYCTLEPCNHIGRTGPCTERIVAAGIRRVVAAMRDPNPRVSGGGFAYLRERGISVVDRVLHDRAADLNAPFVTWMSERRPFVTMKAVMSSDGFVGRRDRKVWLSGVAANRYFHRQRAEIGAIAVGAGTMIADDPQLTPRGAYRFRPLTRVVFDWRLRVPASARLFSTLASGPVIMFVLASEVEPRSAHIAALQDRGVRVEAFETRDLRRAAARLAELEVLSLLVEGGPELHAAFVDADLVDRLQCLATPRVLGDGVPWWQSSTREIASFAPRLRRLLGDDTLVEYDVHRPH